MNTSWKFVPIHDVVNIKSNIRIKYSYIKKKIVNIYKISQLSSSVKTRNEFNDYDYLKFLDKAQLNWLTRFHREWLNSDFKHQGRKFHKSKESRKICYDQNNLRNRDIYNLSRCSGKLVFLGDDVFDIPDNKNWCYRG